MFATVLALALLAFLVAVVVWRSMRVALANRLLHSIVALMDALDTGGAPGGVSRRSSFPAVLLLGPRLAAQIEAVYQTAADPEASRERALACAEVVLRELRDISVDFH